MNGNVNGIQFENHSPDKIKKVNHQKFMFILKSLKCEEEDFSPFEGDDNSEEYRGAGKCF